MDIFATQLARLAEMKVQQQERLAAAQAEVEFAKNSLFKIEGATEITRTLMEEAKKEEAKKTGTEVSPESNGRLPAAVPQA